MRIRSMTSAAGVAAILLVAPSAAPAAGGEAHPQYGVLLFGVAVLVVAAKAGGLLAERLHQPAVLGELIVGIALGNLLLPLLARNGVGLATSDPTLLFLAELGVLILLFDVGLEADLGSLARVGPSSLLVALVGIVVPMALGWGAAAWLLPDSPTLAHVFIGATLTATSVGITARVLQDLGATRSREGTIVLGAAILDDVLGLVVLAVVGSVVTAAATGGAGPSVLEVAGILVRALLFLVVTAGLGHFLSGAVLRAVARTGHPETMLVLGLATCFSLAFVAELIGLAGIVGAFAAGLMLDPYGQGVRTTAESATLRELLHPLSSLFVPLFFVLMGVRVDVGTLLAPAALTLALVLTVCAIAGKLASGLGVVTGGVNRLAVGVGMIPRGEVGLIFAGIGTSLLLEGEPVLSGTLFSAVVVMVLVTTIVAPVGLRRVLAPPPA